ncbi:MAG: acetate--CoA ligase family protein [Bordetella sp.]|nr:acetate--CoA ligase family protein [Bordetella sp.]
MTSSALRRVYRRADTQRLFDPASVAIVGATPKASSFASRTLAHLQGYAGRVHLVNAKYPAIGDRPCHPGLSALDEVPDCVVVAVARDAVLDVVKDCVQLGVGGAVIYASGFGESPRPEHQQLQRELADLTRGTRTRLLGPNCLGTMNGVSGMLATFVDIPRHLHVPGAPTVGLVSQSGAIGVGLAQAVERGVSFSHVLTLGNACDVDVADQIAFLAEDPACDVIACLFEGSPHPLRLLEAGEIARAHGKAVVVFKLAVGASGAEAAMSHTGALAGSDAGYRALFEQAGFVLVERFESLLETACFFAKAPRAQADGLAVVTSSGGAGILAADLAEKHDVHLPQPSPALRATLSAHIPEFGSARNPCDVTAQVLNDPLSFPACAEAFLEQPDIGAIAAPFHFASDAIATRLLELGALAQRHGKIACAYALTGWLEAPGTREMERSPHLALFRSADNCIATLAAWWRWNRALAVRPDAGAGLGAVESAAVDAALRGAGGGRTLSEGSAREVMVAAGVPMVDNRLVRSRSDAVAAAQALGFPVVLKVDTPDLPHKTEAGVVRLRLADADAVAQAYDEVMANALKATSAERIHGVLVQPMLPAGVEILVGARVDPLFGPLLVVGLGGVMVELLKDSVVALAPVGPDRARELLRRLRGSALLQGFRGAPPVDEQALAEVVSRISWLIHERRDSIAELDINPLICSQDGIRAVDALISLR